MKTFNELLKIDELKSYIEENGFSKPTEVQSKAIPFISSGESVKLLAQTGTGKTLAYALPLVEQLKLTEKSHESQKGMPRAIVLLPTKELANQVFQVFKEISHHAKLRVRLLVGTDKTKKIRSLDDQFIDILVGAPGKINQALKKGEIKATDCKHLFLDEADQLLDMGFAKDIQGLYSHFEWSDTKVGLVSATNPENFDEFAAETFRKVNFKEVTLQDIHQAKQTIETFNIHLAEGEKKVMLEMFLNKEAKGPGIIFVNRKETTLDIRDFLSKRFKDQKFYVLHGDMTAKEREDNLKEFRKTGGTLVATDIVARGLDIKKLFWVLNYDLPFEAVYYIHRAGRVGRGGKQGVVYNFVSGRDFNLIRRINDAIKGQSSIRLTAIKENKQRPKQPQRPVKKKIAKPESMKRAEEGKARRGGKKKVSRFVDQKVKRVKRGPRFKKK